MPTKINQFLVPQHTRKHLSPFQLLYTHKQPTIIFNKLENLSSALFVCLFVGWSFCLFVFLEHNFDFELSRKTVVMAVVIFHLCIHYALQWLH